MVDKIRCCGCKQYFSTNNFYKNQSEKNGYSKYCKVCNKIAVKKYQQSEKGKSARKSWWRRHPHYAWAHASIKLHRKKGYNINISVKKLSVIAQQSPKCLICDCDLKWDQGSGDGKLKMNSPTLDRLNNSKDINEKNIQIICLKCNTTKHSRTMTEFVQYCKMIVDKYIP